MTIIYQRVWEMEKWMYMVLRFLHYWQNGALLVECRLGWAKVVKCQPYAATKEVKEWAIANALIVGYNKIIQILNPKWAWKKKQKGKLKNGTNTK